MDHASRSLLSISSYTCRSNSMRVSLGVLVCALLLDLKTVRLPATGVRRFRLVASQPSSGGWIEQSFRVGAIRAPVGGDQRARVFAQLRHGAADAHLAVEFGQKDVVEVVVQPVVEPVEDVH